MPTVKEQQHGTHLVDELYPSSTHGRKPATHQRNKTAIENTTREHSLLVADPDGAIYARWEQGLVSL